MSRVAFQAQMEEMHRQLLRMSSLVQQAIADTIDALINRDVKAARRVIEGDKKINAAHAQVDALCLNLLVLQQPVATDARRITSVVKVITDLERIGDHAVNIARSVIRMGGAPLVKPLVNIPVMAELAEQMVDQAVQAYISGNEAKARAVIERDHELDRLHAQVVESLTELMQRDSGTIPQAVQLLFVSHSLERIGDHATNLGEWQIYVQTGSRERLNP